MFVIQNKETGLYYRNTAGGRGQRRNNGDWTADLQEVKPYRTMAAVRREFIGLTQVHYQFSRRRWEKDPTLPKCCAAVTWSSSRGIKNKCEHYVAAEEARRQRARDRYRVFRVRIEHDGEEQL